MADGKIRGGSTILWPAFMRGVRKATSVQGRLGMSQDPALKAFHRTQGIPRILAVWGSLVRAGCLHVVTVPPPGSDPRLLWERFAGGLALNPDVCAEPPRTSNASLGFASSELLRRVNLELGRMHRTDRNPTVKYLATGVLANRVESRTRLGRATGDFASDWNRRCRKAIISSDAVVAGDLADLPTDWQAELPAEESIYSVDEGEVLDAAVDAVAGLHRLVRRHALKLSKLRTNAPIVPTKEPGSPRRRWLGAPDPVGAAAAEVAGLARTAIDLHQRIRGLRSVDGDSP